MEEGIISLSLELCHGIFLKLQDYIQAFVGPNILQYLATRIIIFQSKNEPGAKQRAAQDFIEIGQDLPRGKYPRVLKSASFEITTILLVFIPSKRFEVVESFKKASGY